jgi:beta-lactam-binding protein with PASTA domain
MARCYRAGELTAVWALRERYLAVGSITKESKADAAQNTVLRQSAQPWQQKWRREPKIDLIVSDPTVDVPDLSGLALDAARRVLRERQLDVGSITGEPKDDAAQNTILRQYPSPGSKVKKGTSIDLIVPEVPTPNR